MNTDVKSKNQEINNLHLEEGINCWKKTQAESGKWLIDGEQYFADLRQALSLAKKQIFIIGWDLSSRLDLRNSGLKLDKSEEFSAFIKHLAESNSQIEIYILIWDYSQFMSIGREKFLGMRMSLFTHSRIHFRYDAEHPINASHHQKFVVIDDQVAYLGGMDLTARRWDTSNHYKKEPGRVGPEGHPYRPYHDVQLRMHGDPAQKLGHLARTRWLRATGIRVSPPLVSNDKLKTLSMEFQQTPMAIARTEPAYKWNSAVREIENLYLDLIQSAKTSVYLENQYFTSGSIAKAILKSLRENTGPEFFLILPKKPSGWVEKETMNKRMATLAARLKKDDHADRFHIFHLRAGDDQTTYVKVHSKLMIIDDHSVFMGSANTNNRSMGTDTECNVLIDGRENENGRQAARILKNRLLGEHLNLSPEEAEKLLRSAPSITKAVAQRGSETRLEQMKIKKKIRRSPVDPAEWVDLNEPYEAEQIMDDFFFHVNRQPFFKNKFFVLGCIIGGVVVLTTIWYITPLHTVIDVEFFRQMLFTVKKLPFSGLMTFGIFVVSAFLFVPLNFLILATASLYSAPKAITIIILGSLTNALIGFGLGRLIGRSIIRRWFSRGAQALSEKISEQGVLPIFIVRLFPIAPFPTVNLICGAMKIQFWPYIAGTFLGILPGTVALTIFQRSLISMIKDLSLKNGLIFAGVTLTMIGFLIFLRKRFIRRR